MSLVGKKNAIGIIKSNKIYIFEEGYKISESHKLRMVIFSYQYEHVMIKTLPFFFLSLFVLTKTASKAQNVYKLWDDQEIPFYKENNLVEYEEEFWGTVCVLNVTDPTLTIYRAKGENTGKAVVVIPGGGYEIVAINHEGHDLARALSEQGITSAVLKYRIPNPESSDQPWNVPLADARRALKLVREKAQEFDVTTNKVGVIGFSAGSHLATVAGLWKSEDIDEIPDFSALIYGVTNLSEVNLSWLEESLYFRKMTNEEVAQNTLLELVNEDTPSAFLVHAYDDDVCMVEESMLYAEKLIDKDVPVEMHLFPKGGHGFGMGRIEDGTDQWVPLFINWVKLNDF